jgi:hypothetical protein
MGKDNQVSGDIGERRDRRDRHREENNRVVRASEGTGETKATIWSDEVENGKD